MNNNKTINCTSTCISIMYTDTSKHYTYPYQSALVDELQLFGRTNKLPIKKDFNKEQSMLFKEAIHGLKLYSGDTISQMNFKRKLAIDSTHRRAVRVLNHWKQNLISDEVDNVLLSLFPKSKLVNQLIEKTKGFTSDEVVNYTKFIELGINKFQIAEKLIEAKVLPITFFNKKQKIA